MRHTKSVKYVRASVALAAVAMTLAACSGGSSAPSAATAHSTASGAASTSTESVLQGATWASTVSLSFSDGLVNVKANGIPNHDRPSKYALPNDGVMVPGESSAHIGDDPTKAQDYDFSIPTTPVYSTTTTAAPLGSIGMIISGAVLFNPYEGDNSTVAMSSNFYLTDTDGTKVYFVDACSGHPTPVGEYHYHAVSSCVTKQVDTSTGPSHLIGVALDGFPIYGSRDIAGHEIAASSLDECNGITSVTPEFPDGIYHYVLPNTTDETSSIRCFHGEVDSAQLQQMPKMGGTQNGG
jgi:hypothetical protein